MDSTPARSDERSPTLALISTFVGMIVPAFRLTIMAWTPPAPPVPIPPFGLGIPIKWTSEVKELAGW